jgi:response regulator RpfG family c-di-GMP phosphodiesterase
MKKPTVLIVDDEKKFTDTFAQFLSERFNVNVLVRKNAREGIEVLDQQRVDVLFQDMIMPGPGGEMVINHIKDLKRLNDMIVFIISGWNEDRHTLKFESLDVKYIPKPISLITTQNVLIEEFETCGGFDYKKKRFL